jgi:mRNA-degrading endonuclease RelE of RelBE toxin-antitoxin system
MNKRQYKFLPKFAKAFSKLKGKELHNLIKKMDQILECEDINHYKNLMNGLKKFKRVHVNDSYVILFIDQNNFIHFVDYDHHDKIYNKNY